jgi:hypothetical protein
LSAVTYPVYTAPGRATLVVFSERGGQDPVSQFVLPIGGRSAERGRSEQALLAVVEDHGPLWWVQYSSQAQRSFTRHERLGELSSVGMWDHLLTGKWVDPVMSLVAALELIRINVTGSLPTVIGNLREFFPGLPDTEYLAKVIGQPFDADVEGDPLFLEAAIGLDRTRRSGPPGGRLEYNGPWTRWRDFNASAPS